MSHAADYIKKSNNIQIGHNNNHNDTTIGQHDRITLELDSNNNHDFTIWMTNDIGRGDQIF